MKVSDLMTTDVVTATTETPLKVAARELSARGVSGLPVVDADGVVLGILSEADIVAKEVDKSRREGNALLRFLEGPPLDDRFDALTVGEAMSSPAIAIGPDRPVTEAANVLLAEGINRLPVVDDEGKLVGLVTRADLVRAFAREDDAIRAEVERCVREDLWIDPARLEVVVEDGIVSLSGELDSETDARVVATVVRRIPGVVDVRSTVHPRG